MIGAGGFPRKFDSYVLLKPLARGGMGQLYLALAGTPGLQKLCVIKQVPPDVIAPENARRFRDEAMVALRLTHGNLVSVFDAGLHGGEIFLAMEHVDGRDLHAVWNRCAERRMPFPVDVAAYVIKELVRGLAYAHSFESLELVHRDVSPANVLLSFSGEVKLTDFGLATSVLKLERTAPGIIYGKVSYLAPEQARREALDGRADLYAAGILLWELLTGRQLFPLRTAADDGASPSDANAGAIRRARNPEITPPSEISDRVPPALERIVMRALAAEKEDRYPNGELMRADLASFLAETAPKTDAARLADFLRPLFADDSRTERREREALMSEATTLLSGAIDARGSAGTVAKAARDMVTRPVTPAEALALAAEVPQTRSDPGSDPRVGTTIGGRYYVRRLCGEGAMGRVYEAHHIDIGRRVAIKVLHANFHNDAALVERFRREARAASKIGHPNIVDVTDSGTTPDGAFYFVMEYLDGVDLEQLIARDGALPLERALLIAAQMTRALEAAHAADIIHRDLKPANVMLVCRNDEDDFVKVLDFGISKDLDVAVGDKHASLTRPDVAIGTPVYMAPEQAAGRPANALTDVYAVGGLLYEMLTGEPPCAGDDAIAVLHRKANEDPAAIGELRPDLPRTVQVLVMRALARSPGERHQSMTALKESLLGAIGGTSSAPLLTPPIVRTVVMPAVQPRQRIPLVPGVLVAVGVAGVGAYLVLSAMRDGEAARAPVAAPRAPAPPASASPGPAAPARSPTPPRLSTGDAPPWPEPMKSAAAARRLADASPATAPPAPPRPAPAPVVVARHEPTRPRTVASTTTANRPTPSSHAPPSPPARAAADPLAELEATDAILARGQRAFDRADYPEAVRRGREAVAAGAPAAGHLLVGDAYYRLERYADAVREYDAVLMAEPTSGSAKRRRALAQQRAAR